MRAFLIMIGVYSITSPRGKVYVGSSKDIEKRSIKKSPIILLEIWEQQENQQQY